MLTLGVYMLVFRCCARGQSNFQLLAVSLNVMPIPTYVLSRQTSVFWGVVFTAYTLHHTPRVDT